MAINENIVTGRKFRKLVDEVNKLWQRISFWTKASDVEFDDGSTAEIKVGAINGVTDSLTSTASNIAASAAAVKALNDKVTELSSNLKVKKIQVGVNSWTPQTVGYFTQNITFDAKQITGYKELTADNFMAVTCVILSGDDRYDVISQGLQFNNVPVCSYNADTGILNVKISYYVNRGIVSARTFAYCFYN